MHESIGEIETHIPVLRRFALSLSRDSDRADDLVQDCVTRAIERIDQFQEGTNLRSWLFTILRNIHLDGVRRTSRGPGFADLDHVPAACVSTQPSQLWHVELREFASNFEQLPDTDRQVLLLVAVEGLSYAEVADTLGIAVGTVKSRLSRARTRLRDAHAGVRPTKPEPA